MPSFEENALFKFKAITSSNYCDSTAKIVAEGCNDGLLYLTTEGKALYYFSCNNDTTTYYRGTYRMRDSSINCVFESEFVTTRNVKVTSHGKFEDIQRYAFELNKINCGNLDYVITKGNISLEAHADTVHTVLERLPDNELQQFCHTVSKLPQLKDFHCSVDSNSTVAKTAQLNLEIVNQIIDRFKSRYPKSQMKKTENDSVIELSFANTKRSMDNDGQPFLYVTISKINGFLIGDLTGDKNNEVVALPKLTQGGSGFWQELFVFSREKGSYRYVTSISSMDVARCTRNSYNGIFYPKKISGGFITGRSRCYTDDDASCCPSVDQETRLILKDNKLKTSK